MYHAGIHIVMAISICLSFFLNSLEAKEKKPPIRTETLEGLVTTVRDDQGGIVSAILSEFVH